jgi:hypothetical protein
MKFIADAGAFLALFCIILLLALTSCDSKSGRVTFEFGMDRGDKNALFLATTSESEIIMRARAELTKPEAERRLHINGRIAEGNDGNLGWNWHFVDNEWSLEEISIEVCDGSPQYVEENLDEWLSTVPGSLFCPWHSFVLRERK